MNWGKVIEGGLGLYLMLPGPEDWGPQGLITIPSSAALGGILLADAFGVKILK